MNDICFLYDDGDSEDMFLDENDDGNRDNLCSDALAYASELSRCSPAMRSLELAVARDVRRYLEDRI